MKEKDYYKRSEELSLPLRCPILNKCTRRALSIYYLYGYSGENKKRIGPLEMLKKEGVISENFEKDAIELSGIAPDYSYGKTFKYYRDVCPEVNLFEGIGFQEAQGIASVSGDWDITRLRENRFKNYKNRHFSECGEFCQSNHKKIKKTTRKNPNYKQKISLLEEVQQKCPFCTFSDTKLLEFHHIDENPANTVLNNLLAVCPNCHSAIGAKDITKSTVELKKKELKIFAKHKVIKQPKSKDEAVDGILKYCGFINEHLSSYEKRNSDLSSEGFSTGKLIGFYNGNEVVKIATEINLDLGGGRYEYYFRNDELTHLYIFSEDYRNQKIEEQEFYIFNNELISYTDKNNNEVERAKLPSIKGLDNQVNRLRNILEG